MEKINKLIILENGESLSAIFLKIFFSPATLGIPVLIFTKISIKAMNNGLPPG